jgi:dihydroorotate dehydrogenase (NAD+) catalytic subunit
MFFSSEPALMSDLIGTVRPLAKRPLIVKLSPNVTRIDAFAKAAEQAGADAVSLVNTFVALAVDARTRRPRLGAGFGGLSGPAIKPIALRMVYECFKAVRIPIVGLGGISCGEDAAEFMIAGATAVEVGTANFWDPAAPCRIARELGEFAKKEKLQNIRELIGSLRL